MFHFSNYPEESKFFDQANKKAIVKLRDESKVKIIAEFIGLKSKMYSIETVDGKESNTTKRENTATEFNEFKATFTILQIYKDSQLNNTKIKNSKIQVQKKTQTLRKS